MRQSCLLDALDKVIWRQMRLVATWPDPFFGPGKMTVFAVILFLRQANGSGQSEHQVGQKRVSRELGILHSQGPAFRTANGPAQRTFSSIPFQKKALAALELLRRNFQTCARFSFPNKPQILKQGFLRTLSVQTGLNQPIPDRFRCLAVAKKCNRHSFHNNLSYDSLSAKASKSQWVDGRRSSSSAARKLASGDREFHR